MGRTPRPYRRPRDIAEMSARGGRLVFGPGHRHTLFLTLDGEELSAADWELRLGVHEDLITNRFLKKGRSAAQSLAPECQRSPEELADVEELLRAYRSYRRALAKVRRSADIDTSMKRAKRGS